MKVLLVHNYYGAAAPSGENRVVELEQTLLERHGFDVRLFARRSDNIRNRGLGGMVEGALSTPWNFSAASQISREIKNFKPDILHAHNTFPMISPSIFPAAKGVARVITLHNYRLLCPAAIPIREDQACTECIDGRTVWPSIKYGCYRNSRLATLPLSASVALHRFRQTWQRDVEALIVLSQFQKHLMSKGGLPANKIVVKPNFYPGEPIMLPIRERKRQVVFVGRLSREKGVDLLLKAWKQWGKDAPKLKIVGDGPLADTLRQQCSEWNLNQVEFLGLVPEDIAQAEIAKSLLLVLPSRCFEGFPMVLREAFAYGTASVVAEIGPLPDLVSGGAGITFKPDDAVDLLLRVKEVFGDMDYLSKMSRAARQEFELHYNEKANFAQLLHIYEDAMRRLGTRAD